MMCLVDKFGHNWQNSCCLVSFLVSCVSLSRAGSTGNIFMLFLFIPFTIQRVLAGEGGVRNIGAMGDFSYCQAETPQAWI